MIMGHSCQILTSPTHNHENHTLLRVSRNVNLIFLFHDKRGGSDGRNLGCGTNDPWEPARGHPACPSEPFRGGAIAVTRLPRGLVPDLPHEVVPGGAIAGGAIPGGAVTATRLPRSHPERADRGHAACGIPLESRTQRARKRI